MSAFTTRIRYKGALHTASVKVVAWSMRHGQYILDGAKTPDSGDEQGKSAKPTY